MKRLSPTSAARIMAAPSSDLPFLGPFAARWLPWIVGLMVFLATLCLMVCGEFWSAAQHIRHDLKGRWTFEITPPAGLPENTLPAFAARALEVIRADSGVARATLVDKSTIVKNLEPWLGQGEMLHDLALPVFVDVASAGQQGPDIPRLQATLSAMAEKTVIQDHEAFYGPMARVARLVQGGGLVLGALIFMASVAIVAIVVSMNLEVHKDIVHTLQLVGAPDSYVVRQCQRHMHRVALMAWGIGGIPALGLWALIQWLLRSGDTLLSGQTGVSWTWVAVVGVPLLFWGLLTLVSRLAVLHTLRHELAGAKA